MGASSALLVVTIVVLFAVSGRLRRLRLDPLRRADLSPVQAAALVAEGTLSEAEAAQLTKGTATEVDQTRRPGVIAQPEKAVALHRSPPPAPQRR